MGGYLGVAVGSDGPPPGMVRVSVTFLDILPSGCVASGSAPFARPVTAPVADVELTRAEYLSLDAYRALYTTIGEPWLWCERRLLSDAALAAIIHHPHVDVLVLTKGEKAVGFVEIDRRRAPDAYLMYLGVEPHLIGQGLGRWMLTSALALAWSHGLRRVRINTSSFDHPGALAFYQRAGFVPVEWVERYIPDPRLSGVLPLTVAPHVPLGRPLEEASVGEGGVRSLVSAPGKAGFVRTAD